jgi:hypothetical protein
MDAFNYLSVMVSVILGLGLTQLLAGVGNLVQVRRRVKLYWLHSVWVLLLVALHLNLWWSFWSLRGVDDWTYVTFVYVLFGPAMLVIASHVIMPELIDGHIDVRTHYFDTRLVFFALLAAAGIWGLFIESVMGRQPLMVLFRALQVLGIVLMVFCALSSSARLHALATVAIVAMFAISIVWTRYGLNDLTAAGG